MWVHLFADGVVEPEVASASAADGVRPQPKKRGRPKGKGKAAQKPKRPKVRLRAGPKRGWTHAGKVPRNVGHAALADKRTVTVIVATRLTGHLELLPHQLIWQGKQETIALVGPRAQLQLHSVGDAHWQSVQSGGMDGVEAYWFRTTLAPHVGCSPSALLGRGQGAASM